MNKRVEDFLSVSDLLLRAGGKVLPAQPNVPEDLIQPLLQRIIRFGKENRIRIMPARDFGFEESSFFIIDVMEPISISIEDPAYGMYLFELDPDRLDILATNVSVVGTAIRSNVMIFHDYMANLYVTRPLAQYYAKAPAQVKAQARAYELTVYLLNQISKDIFSNHKEYVNFNDFSLFIQEFCSRYYYHADSKHIIFGKISYWELFEHLFTPEKLYSYLHSRWVVRPGEARLSPIHMIGNLMEKIDTFVRDPLSYSSLNKMPNLSLEELERMVPFSLLDNFLFPKQRIESILSSLPGDHAYKVIAQNFTPEIIAYLLVTHYSAIYKTRGALDSRKIMQYWMTADFVRSGTYDFDTSRRIVNEKITQFEDASEGKDESILKGDIRGIMSEPFCLGFKGEILRLLRDRKLIENKEVGSLFDECTNFHEALIRIQQYVASRETLSDVDRQMLKEKLNAWSASLDEITDRILVRWLTWQRCLGEEISELRQDVLIPENLRSHDRLRDINNVLCYLFPRVYRDISRLKDLSKPTIIIIHGSAGVGKSTVGNIVAKKLGIPTYFRTTITREVLRQFVPPYIGKEIHRSSYQGKPTVEGFYDQGLRVAKAIGANLDRAIKENTSVMIESGMLLPGTLSRDYYEKANIVEVFLGAPQNKITHRRMVVSSKSLAMDKQKRLKNFTAIRMLDEVLMKIAKERNVTVIEHKDSDETIAEIIDKALNPYADRWAGTINDSVINKVTNEQQQRDQAHRDQYIRLPITGESNRKKESPFPPKMEGALQSIGHQRVESLVKAHEKMLLETQGALLRLRTVEYRLLQYLLSQVDLRYDDIRQRLFYMLSNVRDVSQLVANLKELLYPVLTTNLGRELEQDGYQPDELLGKGSYESIVYDLWEIPEVKDIHNEKYRSMVKRWEEDIGSYAQEYCIACAEWLEAYAREEKELYKDPVIAACITENLKMQDFHGLLRFYYSRNTSRNENLKHLDKPLIVLITGASGVGKSTITKAIKMAFNIPTAFSSDLLREDIRNLVPKDIWPQVHASSFKIEEECRQSLMREYEEARGTENEEEFLAKWKREVFHHYYAHSLIVLEGVQAALNRQIERNQSLIIEGIPLIPGVLPARYYNNANIVQIVVTINDENHHLSRWDRRAAEQPNRYKEGSKRYKEDFIPIRFITKRLEELASKAYVTIINNVDLHQSIKAALEVVGGPFADKFTPIPDEHRRDASAYLSYHSRKPLKIWGAWCTDIDDTVIWSGQMPTKGQVAVINNFIRALAQKNVAWIPMSGVAFEKMKPRILDKILPELKKYVIYYGGDGSTKYVYDEEEGVWENDGDFERLLSPAQAIAIMGAETFRDQLSRHLAIERQMPSTSSSIVREVQQNIYAAQIILGKNRLDSTRGIIDDLKDVLRSHGFDPEKSQVYYRGGSVSWMMLGDIDADSYAQLKARTVRDELLALVDAKLERAEYLSRLSPSKTKVIKPFPGARGIKFVLEGNDKERSMRDIIQTYRLLPEEIIFVGNELIDGGNDFVVTRIKGIKLLSLGKKTEAGIPFGGFGVDANQEWYKMLSAMLSDLPLEGGEMWVRILDRIENEDITL
ncbi:MAG: hypothetical protein JXD19_06650, partial [Deltaproteobacteria bacterium]|nr:hypothetical protein [Deltaproteobacteria bacterium]